VQLAQTSLLPSAAALPSVPKAAALMGFRDGSTGFRPWGLEGIVSSHPTRERSWLKSDAYTGSGKGEREGAERYGGGRRFGYMT